MKKEDFFKKKQEETISQYIGRVYRHKADLEMTNAQIANNINKELGTNYGESTLRCKAKDFNDGVDFGYDQYAKASEGNEEVSNSVASLKEIQEEIKRARKEKISIEKEIQRMEAQEEKRLKVVEYNGYYTIYSSTREIQVSKEILKRIKLLYCDGNKLQVNQLCRELDIPRRDFMLIKNAFNIVHDDVPYIDEELESSDIEDLVDRSLENKKKQYFLKLESKEIDNLKKEVEKFRSNDYLYDKIIDRLNNIKVNPVKYNVEVKRSSEKRSALLDLADIHCGLKCKNFINSYDLKTMQERADKLVEETIKTCSELGVSDLHLSNLGDNIAGIIHTTIIKQSEVDVITQVEMVTELIIKMLVEFSVCGQFDNIYYASVVGNHGRIYESKDKNEDKENFERLIDFGIKKFLQGGKEDYSNIHMEDNKVDDNVIVKEIEGVKIYEVHGHLDNFAKVASNLGMRFGKSDEVHIAHQHHNKSEEFHEVEVWMCRSFCGIDTHSNNMRLGSKAGQRLYVYANGQRRFVTDIIF